MNDQEHDLLDVSHDDIIPYFMWDYQYTVGQIKDMLAKGPESQRIWLMSKIMRDARYCDVWKFMTLQDFLKHRERLMERLGWKKPFWQFLFSRWVKYEMIEYGDNPHFSAN